MKFKISTGYPKIKIQKKTKKNAYIKNIFLAHYKKIPFLEKIIKIFIFIILRIVIRPKKWKHPEKNYKIIDLTYKKIISTDFLYIPSSIAFYLLISLLPTISLIVVFYQMNFIKSFVDSIIGKDSLTLILDKFIPGITPFIKEFSAIFNNKEFMKPGIIVTVIFSIIITIWTASSAFSKFIFTQSHIFNHKNKSFKFFLNNKIQGMILVLGFACFLFFGLILNVWISNLLKKIIFFNLYNKIFLNIFLFLILNFEIFITVILFFKFSSLFKIKIKNLIPGATITTIPVTLFIYFLKFVFSLLTYNKYGLIGIIMYVSIMSLFITYCLFIGIIINASYHNIFITSEVHDKISIFSKIKKRIYYFWKNKFKSNKN